MMKRLLQPGLFIMILCLLFPQLVQSQAQYFYNINSSKFPTVKMKYIARDAAGVDNFLNPNAYTSADFSIMENGVAMTPVLDCGVKADTPSVQIMFLINNSKSMDDTPNCLSWAKEGIKAAIDSLYWVTGTKMALVTYVSESGQLSPFTNDENFLTSQIGALKTANGSTDYIRAFLLQAYPWTMFDQTDAKIPRALVFISNKTDPDRVNDWNIDEAMKIANECKKRNILFFYVAMNQVPNENLKTVSRLTGGIFFNPTKKADAIANIRKVVHVMQKREYCEISYVAPYGCDQASKTRNVEIKFIPKDTTLTRVYNAPDASIPKIQLSAGSLNFGKPADDKTNKSITLTYHGPDMTLQGLTFSTDKLFEVKNLSAPKVLKDGSEQELLIGYTNTPPTEPVTITATIKSADFLCQSTLPSFSIKANWFDFVYNVEQQINTVEVSKTVMLGDKTSQSVKCAIKNRSNAEIGVNIAITDDAEGNFTIKSGGGDKKIDTNTCLGDIEIEFLPKTVGAGTKTAKLHIKVTEPANITNTYDIALSGKVIPTSVEDIYPDEHNCNLSLLPNPLSEFGKISFMVVNNSYTSLDLYNSLGSHIESLIGRFMEKGSYTAEYNAKNLTPGVYFLKLQNGSVIETLRIVINK